MHVLDLYADWGARVRAEREAQGLTQAELADKAGVSQQMISAIERGTFGAGDETRRALARVFGKRPVELFPYPEDLPTPAVPA
jgi:transcriptional regulator with XRE-family HTH domain